MEAYEKEYMAGLTARLTGLEMEIYKLRADTPAQEEVKTDIQALLVKCSIKLERLKVLMQARSKDETTT